VRVVIVGANGQLGAELTKQFSQHDVIPWTRKDFDVRDHRRAEDAVLGTRPDVLINTAAFHKTDACEDDPALAFSVNASAVRNLALASAACQAAFVHVSTDYVFDGARRNPYVEDDWPNPINVYGTSKLAGERFAAAACPRSYIVRIASLFGTAGSSGKGGNMVETILAKARRGEVLTFVDDVVMSPTYAVDAARAVRVLIEAAAPSGTYHLTNDGACSWYAFAAEVLRQARVKAELRATTLAELAPRASRPHYSALTSRRLSALGLTPLRPWQEALAAYLTDRTAVAHA